TVTWEARSELRGVPSSSIAMAAPAAEASGTTSRLGSPSVSGWTIETPGPATSVAVVPGTGSVTLSRPSTGTSCTVTPPPAPSAGAGRRRRQGGLRLERRPAGAAIERGLHLVREAGEPGRPEKARARRRAGDHDGAVDGEVRAIGGQREQRREVADVLRVVDGRLPLEAGALARIRGPAAAVALDHAVGIEARERRQRRRDARAVGHVALEEPRAERADPRHRGEDHGEPAGRGGRALPH